MTEGNTLSVASSRPPSETSVLGPAEPRTIPSDQSSLASKVKSSDCVAGRSSRAFESSQTAYSTSEFAPSERAQRWNRLCSELYSPLEIEPLDPHAFSGQMAILHDERFRVTRFRSAPVRMKRTRAHTRAASRPHLTAYLRLSGTARFTVGDNPLAMRPGDLILLDSFTQFEFHAEEETSALAIGFPERLVSAHLPNVPTVVGRVLSGELDVIAAATATMRIIQRQADSGSPSLNLARGLLELVSASCERTVEPLYSSPSAQRWLRRIDSFINANLKNADLAPSRIAEALGISQRYLRMLCADKGEPLSHHILRLRLEECARCLGSPEWQRVSITDLAHHWGFGDSGYFARCFREKFGCSPSQYRAGHG